MSSHRLSAEELTSVRTRIDGALEVLAAVEAGEYGFLLDVDMDADHPLDSAFASINELLTTFQAEEEQSRAFRSELEDKLAVVDQQRQAIRELSTPIIELWHGVLCLPVVGMMDTARSVDMTGALLQAVSEKGAKYAIVDVTGIDVMDTRTVDHFIRMAKAVRLLGADCALTGISPYIAQTVVHMGITLDDITTHRTLRDALVNYVESHR
jgi:rsbT co-antagonist protein RsbR